MRKAIVLLLLPLALAAMVVCCVVSPLWVLMGWFHKEEDPFADAVDMCWAPVGEMWWEAWRTASDLDAKPSTTQPVDENRD